VLAAGLESVQGRFFGRRWLMATSGRSGAEDTTAHGSDEGFVRALGLFPATTVNMSQMVGIGPFITIPLMISAMGGPQALIGWVLGAVLAMADGLVWAELGAAMPAAGGSYVYLREAYQYSTGRLVPFLFIWSTLLATPLIMSTGMIGMTQYLGYFHHLTGWQSKAVAVALTVLTVALLYRRIESIAAVVRFLWFGMIVTVLLVIVATLTHFDPGLAFDFPKHAVSFSVGFFSGLGAGLLIAIYDYLGYFTVAYLGDEVQDPGRVIPRAIVFSILGVCAIYIVMNVGIMGVIPWREATKSTNIGTDAVEAVWGHVGGVIITLLIVTTAFASVYCGLLGGSRLPYNAARDHLFFGPFGRLHPTLRFPHVSLLAMGVVTAIASLFTLQSILNALIAVSIVVQFIGGIAALVILRRKQPELRRPYRQWLYPVPCIIALVGWVYIFVSSGWSAIELAIVWTALGVVAYLIWARYEKVWPFGPKEIREVFVEEQRTSTQAD
jgi:amino acid transporter